MTNKKAVSHDNDGDIISWRGGWYEVGWIPTPWWMPNIPIYAWQVGVDIFLDIPGSLYENVWVSLTFKYTGAYPLHIVMYYQGGGSEVFYENPTGGYIQKTGAQQSEQIYRNAIV